MSETILPDVVADSVLDHPLLELPVRLGNGGTATVGELALRFYESPLGEHMNTQPYRFVDPFGYDRAEMVEDLGEDVLPMNHQCRTLAYEIGIIDEDNLVEDAPAHVANKISTVLFAGAIHDIGELTHPEVVYACGGAVGDIPMGKKTPEDKALEAKVRRYAFETIYKDVAPDVLDDAERIISHADHTILHEIYEVAHELQTYVTAYKAECAYIRHKADALAGESLRNEAALRKLELMAAEVGTRRRNVATVWAWQYAFACRVLTALGNYGPPSIDLEPILLASSDPQAQELLELMRK